MTHIDGASSSRRVRGMGVPEGWADDPFWSRVPGAGPGDVASRLPLTAVSVCGDALHHAGICEPFATEHGVHFGVSPSVSQSKSVSKRALQSHVDSCKNRFGPSVPRVARCLHPLDVRVGKGGGDKEPRDLAADALTPALGVDGVGDLDAGRRASFGLTEAHDVSDTSMAATHTRRPSRSSRHISTASATKAVVSS